MNFTTSIVTIIILAILLGYLFGSINFAIIMGKIKHKDITKLGSNNPGTTNTLRVLGKKEGITVFILDVIKVILPTLIVYFVFRFSVIYQIINLKSKIFYLGYLVYLCPLLCIIGHIFPIYFKFKGGKGIACYFGFTLMLSPFITIIWIIVGISIYKAKKIVSLASITCVSITPFLLLIPGINWTYLMMPNITMFHQFNQMIKPYMINMSFLIIFSLLISILVVYKHKQNLYNLINGNEKKLTIKANNEQ